MERLFAEAHAMLLHLYIHLADSETQKWPIRSQHGAQEDDTRRIDNYLHKHAERRHSSAPSFELLRSNLNT
ncbi:hypothetical protein AV530_006503 [Patagioenas fasciata monilis]|uniref:Uncharacterized protein n=1 Tax=Patagioenas fasciata monilis TaxID=372326 RepID=A0A1V4KGM9_PATFA|nr:hypothetical protein AV530_006503 [Patagioenas fasciata monilis]